MRIIEDDLTHPAVRALLEEHMASMLANSPKDSTHFLDFDALRGPGVTFWTAWVDDALAGCGALKRHDAALGEVKSMRTHRDFLRRGIAAAILSHLLTEARSEGLRHISLETGSGPAFQPAHALYYSHGFVDCSPFADYKPDPFSRFMTLAL
jgi:putative acetyltransferase